MGIEGGVSKLVYFRVVHGYEELSALHGGRDEGGHLDSTATGLYKNFVLRRDFQELGVNGIDFHIDLGRTQFAQDF